MTVFVNIENATLVVNGGARPGLEEALAETFPAKEGEHPKCEIEVSYDLPPADGVSLCVRISPTNAEPGGATVSAFSLWIDGEAEIEMFQRLCEVALAHHRRLK
jgi:hypothetical protein